MDDLRADPQYYCRETNLLAPLKRQSQERLAAHEADDLCGRYDWPARGHW